MDGATLADLPEVSATRDDEIFVVVALVVLLAHHRRRCEKRHEEPNGGLALSCRRLEHCSGPSDRSISQTWHHRSNGFEGVSLRQAGELLSANITYGRVVHVFR